jgi:dUTP pyrophosphatase
MSYDENKLYKPGQYDNNTILCQVLDGGTLPTKAHATDAGWDLYATFDFSVEPGQVIKHPLNIKLQLPEESYAEITSKSGNGSKGLLVYAGIIDEGYRGVVHVVMTNVNQLWSTVGVDGGITEVTTPGKTLEFKKGQKLAQLIIHPYRRSFMHQVEALDENTSRGIGGFGSSGNSLV